MVSDNFDFQRVLSQLVQGKEKRREISACAVRGALRTVSAISPYPDAKDTANIHLRLLSAFRACSVAWSTLALGLDARTQANSAANGLEEFHQGWTAWTSKAVDDVQYSPGAASFSCAYALQGIWNDYQLSIESLRQSSGAVVIKSDDNGLSAEVEIDLDRASDMEGLVLAPLWTKPTPNWATVSWGRIAEFLNDSRSGWEVWTDWYDARLRGGPTHPDLSPTANERIEVARVLEIEDEDWEQGPAHVNAKIKAIIERETERDARERDETDQTASVSQDALSGPPTELDPGPGPNYSIQEGQLHLDPSPPVPSDEASSAALLPLLKRATADLQQLCQKLDNTHPRLAETVRNYAETLDAPFEGLSVPSVWAYGGLLAELKQGFETQSPSTMTAALEPEVSAQLANVVRQHAAFILGTEQGRDLVERADRFQQAPQTIEEIREPAEEILDELSDNEDLVDAETRAAHTPIRDHLRTIEWGACRTSYAGYLIVRKATFAMLRLVVGKEVSLAAIVGTATGVGVLVGDPSLDFLRIAIPVLRDQAAAILAFYKHSPELRSYAEYALNLIEAAEEKLDPRIKSEDDAQ